MSLTRTGPVDILGRVGLGVSGGLGFGKRGRKRDRIRLHAAQDVVARAVQDPAHLDEPIARKAILQRAEHGNTASDRRLEAHLTSLCARQIEELRAVVRHQLLVRRDDGLASEERTPHPFVGRVQSAHQLDHDVDTGRQDIVRRLGPTDRRRHPVDTLACDIAVEDVREPNVRHLAAAQDARDRLPDGAEAKQRDPRTLVGTCSFQCHVNLYLVGVVSRES
jgi:hypothetical protein